MKKPQFYSLSCLLSFLLVLTLVGEFSLAASSSTSLKNSKKFSQSRVKKLKLKKLKKKKSSYSAQFSSEVSQGLEEEDRPVFGLGMSITKNWTKRVSLTGDVSFYNAFKEYEEDYIRGFEDVNLTLSHSSLLRSRAYRLNLAGFVGLIAPTSETSQDASMRFGSYLGFHLSKKISLFQFYLKPVVTYLNHQYDTANKAGTIPNYNVIVGDEVGVSLKFNRHWSWTNAYKFSSLWDYKKRQRDVQEYRSVLNLQWNRHWSTYLSYKQKSDVLTNVSLFDQENTMVLLGVGYGI